MRKSLVLCWTPTGCTGRNATWVTKKVAKIVAVVQPVGTFLCVKNIKLSVPTSRIHADVVKRRHVVTAVEVSEKRAVVLTKIARLTTPHAKVIVARVKSNPVPIVRTLVYVNRRSCVATTLNDVETQTSYNLLGPRTMQLKLQVFFPGLLNQHT